MTASCSSFLLFLRVFVPLCLCVRPIHEGLQILQLADDFLDEVFDRHDPDTAAVAVGDDGHVLAFGLEPDEHGLHAVGRSSVERM